MTNKEQFSQLVDAFHALDKDEKFEVKDAAKLRSMLGNLGAILGAERPWQLTWPTRSFLIDWIEENITPQGKLASKIYWFPVPPEFKYYLQIPSEFAINGENRTGSIIIKEQKTSGSTSLVMSGKTYKIGNHGYSRVVIRNEDDAGADDFKMLLNVMASVYHEYHPSAYSAYKRAEFSKSIGKINRGPKSTDKSKIWPQINIDEEKANGADAGATFLKWQLRYSIKSDKPGTPTGDDYYETAVKKIKSRIMPIKEFDELIDELRLIPEKIKITGITNDENKELFKETFGEWFVEILTQIRILDWRASQYADAKPFDYAEVIEAIRYSKASKRSLEKSGAVAAWLAEVTQINSEKEWVEFEWHNGGAFKAALNNAPKGWSQRKSKTIEYLKKKALFIPHNKRDDWGWVAAGRAKYD